MKKKLKELIRRVEFWPEKQQENVARILFEMEAQERSPYRLTERQTTELERRIAEPHPRFLTLKEVRSRLAKLGA